MVDWAVEERREKGREWSEASRKGGERREGGDQREEKRGRKGKGRRER